MSGLVLLLSTICAGQVPDTAAPRPSKAVVADSKEVASQNPDQALSEYNALREKTPATAAGQWRLALWCEKHGLKTEAYVHFTEVARLEPRRDAVWRKLGFKKVGNRWATDEQLAEESEQKKAGKLWAPRLKKLHKDIHGTNGAVKRDQAQEAMKEILDPRAVLPLYREFGGGDSIDQTILIEAMERIKKSLASKVLGLLAVYGKTEEVRGKAISALQDRPADEFLDLLVSLMVDPLKYEVRPVGGPGSPGVIFVEGERFNTARFYAPPAATNITPGPGDIISYDSAGMPTVLHPVGQGAESTTSGVPGSKTLVRETSKTTTLYAQISPAQLMQEAQRGAVMAQAQLQADLLQIKSMNDARRQFNDLVMGVAKMATGKELGGTAKEWREALAAQKNISREKAKDPVKPTIPEVVDLVYNPVFQPVGYQTQILTQTRVYVDT